MNGAQLLAKMLHLNDVSHVFALPGGHNLRLLEALSHYEIEIVFARHEQGAAFMADGYARASGKPGIVITTAGPGITNVLTTLAGAYAESSPVLLLAHDNFNADLGFEQGLFHELLDSRKLLASVTQWEARVTNTDSISNLINAAFRKFKTDRPRPIALTFPTDILNNSFEKEIAPIAPLFFTDGLDPEQVSAAQNLIHSARKPVIYAGRGALISGVSEEIRELAESIAAPVVTSAQGRGVLPEDHPLALGCVWDRVRMMHSLMAETDLIIAIGTSFSKLATSQWKIGQSTKIFHIDPDPFVCGKFQSTALAICADGKSALKAMSAQLPKKSQSELKAAIDSVAKLRSTWEEEFSSKVEVISSILTQIRNALPRSTRFVCDMTILAYWAQRFLPVYESHQMIAPYYFGTLGFGFPASLGVKIADSSKPVVALCGDGGVLFNSQEMATAKKYETDALLIVFNDNSYGAVAKENARVLGKTKEDFSLNNPDFQKLAEAYEWNAYRCDCSKIYETLREAQNTQGPTLVEVILDSSIPSPNDIAWNR